MIFCIWNPPLSNNFRFLTVNHYLVLKFRIGVRIIKCHSSLSARGKRLSAHSRRILKQSRRLKLQTGNECPVERSAGIAVSIVRVAEVANIMSTHAELLQASQGKRFSSVFHGDRHVNTEDIAAFISSNVSAKARNRVVAHLADCSACRRLAAEVVMSRAAVNDTE